MGIADGCGKHDVVAHSQALRAWHSIRGAARSMQHEEQARSHRSVGARRLVSEKCTEKAQKIHKSAEILISLSPFQRTLAQLYVSRRNKFTVHVASMFTWWSIFRYSYDRLIFIVNVPVADKQRAHPRPRGSGHLGREPLDTAVGCVQVECYRSGASRHCGRRSAALYRTVQSHRRRRRIYSTS